ncbi:MAG: hypothetical protein HY369_04515 [Candidatus Aenigmarchaeota archaeon]|nr:hypothetical protein [Candidatus Aenigmarchaeota archaeon]
MRLKGLEEAPLLVLSMVLALLALVVVIQTADAFSHPDAKALQHAVVVASFIQTLSLSDSGQGTVEFGDPFDVSVVYYDDSLIGGGVVMETSNGPEDVDANVDGESGHYVMVTANRDGAVPKTTFILLYPQERDDGLLVTFTDVTRACVSKSLTDPVAKVVPCA